MEVSANRRRRLDEGTGSSKASKDFNKIKKEDDKRLSGLTLSAVLGGVNAATEQSNVRTTNAGAGWTSSAPVPTSDIMISRRNSGRSSPDDPKYDESYPEHRSELNSSASSRSMMLRRNSSRVPSMASGRYGPGESEAGGEHRRNPSSGEEEGGEESGEEEDGDDGEDEEEDGGGGEEAGAKMSLMALLAETDKEMGLDGATYMMDDDDDEDEDEDEEDEDRAEYSNCSVCMVRHKGAASTTCGHSFCRLCSKELYVQRGNCPMCNGYLMEILEVF